MAIQALQGLEDEMKKCFRCSLCKMVPLPVVTNPKYLDCCPANLEYLFHGYSGSGKSIMALSLLDGRIEVDESLARTTFACTTCGLCDVACKFIMDAERHVINMALREHLVDQGLGRKEHQEGLEKVRERALASTEAARTAGVKSLPRQKAKVLLYGGVLENDPASARTFANLAKLAVLAGVDVGVLDMGEPGTGLFAYWTGHREDFINAGQYLVDNLDATSAKTVVALSGADLGMLRSKIPEAAHAPRARVVHAVEFLEELVKKKKLVLKTPLPIQATYHDPCYLGRHSEPPVEWEGEYKMSHNCMTYTDPPKPVNRGGDGVFDPPRNLLKAMPGLDFKEMWRIREYSFCCGGGGGVPQAFPQLAKNTANRRVAEARDAGAEVLVTACHHCVQNLSVQQGVKSPLPVRHIVDLVAESVGIKED